MSEEELEVYGIDWEGLRDNALLDSQQRNNPSAEVQLLLGSANDNDCIAL
ncbi:hypothetical protein K438DRAFT_1973001 [Mycena galopus ATCC 62051]|nr:hypothetical protein K438DRAFT_1972895 [Mycena galopus ATCC 62051]KAF8187387.1 hypothetical protein K438DRAFT_1973001 [Mycena galopus ATCC 62051]